MKRSREKIDDINYKDCDAFGGVGYMEILNWILFVLVSVYITILFVSTQLIN